MSLRSTSRLLLPLFYMGGIHLLSSIPDDGTPETLGEKLLRWATPELQNLLHLPLFGGLAAAWYWALRPLTGKPVTALGLTLVITVCYSFFDEWHQLHVPGRYGSWTDIALNLLGAAVVLGWLSRRPGSPASPDPSAGTTRNEKP